MTSSAHPTTSDPVPTVVKQQLWKAVVILFIVFMLGLVCGVGGSAWMARRSIRQQMTQTTIADRAPVDAFMERIGTRLSRELELDAGQTEAVNKELSQTAIQLKQVRLKGVTETRLIALDTLRRIQQHVPEERRKELRQRAIARLAPWGLLNEADQQE